MAVGQPIGQQFYCELIIKNNQYNSGNINYLVIREWIFDRLPTIEIQFMDEGYLTEVSPLEDGEDILVILAKHEADENPLQLTFTLCDYEVGVISDNKKSIVTMTGILKVNDMYTLKNRRFSRQNSALVLQQIAEEANIPYSNPYNVVPTDNMIWYQSDISNLNFIRHVLQRAYIPDDLPLFYANTKNQFVYTSLMAELNKQESKKLKYNVENFESNIKDDSDKDNTIWFNGYDLVNYSGYINKKIGYGTGIDYYDLNAYQTRQYSDVPKITDLTYRNKNLVGSSVRNKDHGDLISLNVHDHYFEAMAKNELLLYNFFAMGMVVSINALDDVKLMDKLTVEIPSIKVPGDINEVLTGTYLISGIQHEISNGGYYLKKISINRNGMNKSVDQLTYVTEE